METVFDRMKSLIIFNLDTISRLIDDAEQIRQSVDQSEDQELKKKLLKQIDEMDQSIQALVSKTRDLFDVYKQLVRRSSE